MAAESSSPQQQPQDLQASFISVFAIPLSSSLQISQGLAWTQLLSKGPNLPFLFRD